MGKEAFLRVVSVKMEIESVPESSKSSHRNPSEILPTLLGCHQELLLDMMWRRWPFGFKGQFEVWLRLWLKTTPIFPNIGR